LYFIHPLCAYYVFQRVIGSYQMFYALGKEMNPFTWLAGDGGELTTAHILLGVWSEVGSPGHKILSTLGFNDEKAGELESLISKPGCMDDWWMSAGKSFCFNFTSIIDTIVCTIIIWTGCSVVPTDLECIKPTIFGCEVSFLSDKNKKRKQKERNKHPRTQK